VEVADLFVLVHAPVLGPASWAFVANELAGSGRRVAVPSLAGFTDAGPPFTPRLVRIALEQVPAGAADRVVLVVHSGAGAFAPHLADGITGRRVIVVFADAAIPPRSGSAEIVTATDSSFLPYLRELAVGGMVPPWPRWWPDDAMAELVPDAQARRLVLDEARSLPLAHFEEVLPPLPASWRACHPGYLRFSQAYAELAREAADRGWPVRDLPGEHLHMLVSPGEVAAAIVSLASE